MSDFYWESEKDRYVGVCVALLCVFYFRCVLLQHNIASSTSLLSTLLLLSYTKYHTDFCTGVNVCRAHRTEAEQDQHFLRDSWYTPGTRLRKVRGTRDTYQRNLRCIDIYTPPYSIPLKPWANLPVSVYFSAAALETSAATCRQLYCPRTGRHTTKISIRKRLTMVKQ